MPLLQKLKKAGCIFFFRFRSQVATPRYQNVIFGPFLGHFFAQISFFGIYLWNGASTSKVEESGMHFLSISVPGKYPLTSKCHLWPILSYFGSFLGHFGSFWVILGHLGTFGVIFGPHWAILGHWQKLTGPMCFFAGNWWGFFCRPTAYISCRASVEKNTSNCPAAPGLWFGQSSRLSKRVGFNK